MVKYVRRKSFYGGIKSVLTIADKSDEELVTLPHGKNVFHDALKKVREGEVRFHVTNENGLIPDYDLVYTDNMHFIPESIRNIMLKITQGCLLYAPFPVYDETNTDMLCLDFLKQYTKIEFEIADEYSIALARTVLAYTDIPIYYIDEKFDWFITPSDNAHKIASFPDSKEKDVLRVTQNTFDMGYSTRDWSVVCSIAAFQNVFFWQSLRQHGFAANILRILMKTHLTKSLRQTCGNTPRPCWQAKKRWACLPGDRTM